MAGWPPSLRAGRVGHLTTTPVLLGSGLQTSGRILPWRPLAPLSTAASCITSQCSGGNQGREWGSERAQAHPSTHSKLLTPGPELLLWDATCSLRSRWWEPPDHSRPFQEGLGRQSPHHPASYPFFLTALLRYNSHTIQFTHLKHTVQGLLAYSHCWATITTIDFRPYLSPQKETLYLSAVTLQPLPVAARASPQPLATTNLFSGPMELPTLAISYKWNLIVTWSPTGFFHLT